MGSLATRNMALHFHDHSGVAICPVRPYPTMLRSEQNCAQFCSEWGIVGYGTGAFYDLWIRSWAQWGTRSQMLNWLVIGLANQDYSLGRKQFSNLVPIYHWKNATPHNYKIPWCMHIFWFCSDIFLSWCCPGDMCDNTNSRPDIWQFKDDQ